MSKPRALRGARKTARNKSRPKAARRPTGPAAVPLLADATSAAVITCAGDRVIAANPAAKSLLGYRTRMPAGLPLSRILLLPQGPSDPAVLARARRPHRGTLLGRDGSAIPCTLRAAALDHGQVALVAVPRGAEAPPQHLRGVLDSLPEGVLAVDARGAIRLANVAAHRLLGAAAGTLTGVRVARLLPAWAGEGATRPAPALLGSRREVAAHRCDGGEGTLELTLTKAADANWWVLLLRDITSRRAAEVAQQAAAERLNAEVESRAAEVRALARQQARILESASDGIVAVSLDGRIDSANRAAADMLNRDIRGLVGLPLDRAFVHGTGATTGTPGRAAPLRAQLWTGPYHVALETRLARTDGESFDAEYTIAPITEGRTTHGYVVSFRDITDRKRAESAMRLAATVFEHTPEGLLVADARGRVTRTNPAFCRITGYEPREIIGRSITDVLLAEASASPGVLDPLQSLRQTQWEQWCKSKSGKRYAARITLSIVRDADDQVQQYAALISDITQRKLDEEKIVHQANYDQLTGLANRTLFMDRLTRLVVESRRAKNSIGLMFIDLDGFKAVNDTLGHDAGDLLLKGCARRLEKCVRESDTVARLGGDEFTVIMPLIDSLEAAGVVADRIIRSLCEPFDLDGRPGHVSASIGISMLPAQASDASGLLHNADVAMYAAKRLGKANFQFYRPDMEAGAPGGAHGTP